MMFTEKRRADVAEDEDFVVKPGEGGLMFSNRLETQGGQFIMVLNRAGAEPEELKELPAAQRRTWLLYQLLTDTDEGRKIMQLVLEMDDRIASGEIGEAGQFVDLAGIEPHGNA
jgi:hypothetical protein